MMKQKPILGSKASSLASPRDPTTFNQINTKNNILTPDQLSVCERIEIKRKSEFMLYNARFRNTLKNKIKISVKLVSLEIITPTVKHLAVVPNFHMHSEEACK